MSYGQGGPQWSPGESQWGQQQPPGTSTPDWGQLAAETERRRRRKRLLTIGGGALAALAIGTVVAIGIVRQGDDEQEPGGQAQGTDPAGGTATDSPAPEPSFEETYVPPPPQPREFITDAEKDTAPFTADGFYAGETMDVDGREYTRVALHEATDCAEGASEALGGVLTEHGCVALLRATYTAEGVAVTIGVAQFPTEEDAAAVRAAAETPILVLANDNTPAFCGRGGCRTTKNQVGRYGYFTIAGNSDNTPDSGESSPAKQASQDGNTHAHARIVLRGENQASASASAIVEDRRKNDNG
jgi:hypothetical protein